jgi:hypothetical protein
MMAEKEKLDSVPAGVTAISTRSAAQILMCSMGHVRNLAAAGAFGKTYRLAPRILALDADAVKAYLAKQSTAEKQGKKRGPKRGGFQIDT